MYKNRFSILILLTFFAVSTFATHKVYIIHGFAGLGIELGEIRNAIDKEGITNEIYVYPSLTTDIDSVGVKLFLKIQLENYDTVSFVTHSMGALLVRSLYEHISPKTDFPFIHRIVMIAPPNNGSPVADYFSQFKFIKFIMGPNVNNLTTNPKTGAGKYPIPTCEVGLISGSYGGKKGFNALIKDDNDGVLIPENTKLGIEKEIVFVRNWHVGLLFDKTVIKYTVRFLRKGKFR